MGSGFNAADLPLMMRIADLPSRYRKHFLGALNGAVPVLAFLACCHGFVT